MATKVECKTCSKCLWKGLGEGAPNCLPPPPGSHHQSPLRGSQSEALAKERRRRNKNSPQNVIYRACICVYIYISIYM